MLSPVTLGVEEAKWPHTLETCPCPPRPGGSHQRLRIQVWESSKPPSKGAHPSVGNEEELAHMNWQGREIKATETTLEVAVLAAWHKTQLL